MEDRVDILEYMPIAKALIKEEQRLDRDYMVYKLSGTTPKNKVFSRPKPVWRMQDISGGAYM